MVFLANKTRNLHYFIDYDSIFPYPFTTCALIHLLSDMIKDEHVFFDLF